jgi:nucleotide-binding universal stress UspA family protein
MYKKMVVLLDGSELAEVVFDYAQELAGRLHLDIELLHVCTRAEVDQMPMRRAYIEQKAALLCTRAEETRRRLEGETLAECIHSRGTVACGYPAEEILKHIDENDIDLVLMSTHGSSGIRAWDLGEVANKVIHASKVPVWLVPAELRDEARTDTLPQRRMIVPLSGTKQSEAVIPHVVSLVTQRAAEGETVLVHVYEPPSFITSQEALDAIDAEHARMKAYLESVAAPMREQGVDVRTEVLTGRAPEAIIGFMKDNPAQLVAMATRGRTGLSRMFFGSVSEGMIHLIKVTPLLLVSGAA